MGLIDIFYPKICVGCRREGYYICSECQRKLLIPEQICPLCCKPSLDGWTHARCQKREGMERLLVGLPYRGMVQSCLKKVKYKSSWDIVEFLFSLCTFEAIEADLVVTSVPMFAQKARERGFDQAEILAKLLAKRYDLTYQSLLERTRQTQPMFGLTKEERKDNVRGAFKLMNQFTNIPTEQKVILVDDVWTTGSTIRECVQILKKSGVAEVWGLTLAR